MATRKASAPTGYIIYQGPSELDGKPIVVVALVKSANKKTANMVQTYILRSDIDPRYANKSGADYSICGTCIHRGTPTDNPDTKLAKGRTCYVNMGQGVLIVYNGFKAGKYPVATPGQLAALGRGRMVRIGTYGDGAAVRQSVWNELISEAEGHTGYSHQSTMPKASFNAALYMVSADNLSVAKQAWNMGQRTFRVIPVQQWAVEGKLALDKNEALCPASIEAGAKTTCEACKLCGGTTVSAKSIAIVAHGTAKAAYIG
jgi:hypothetical protein